MREDEEERVEKREGENRGGDRGTVGKGGGARVCVRVCVAHIRGSLLDSFCLCFILLPKRDVLEEKEKKCGWW